MQKQNGLVESTVQTAGVMKTVTSVYTIYRSHGTQETFSRNIQYNNKFQKDCIATHKILSKNSKDLWIALYLK